MSDDKSTQQYDISSIHSLTACEHVRKRPAMYVRDFNSPEWVQLMVYGLLENFLDQVVRGQSAQIIITLYDNYELSIQDNGAGIPVQLKEDKSILEIVLTEVRAGSIPGFIARSSSLGFAPVNALSETLLIEVKRDGYLWRQTYQAGLKTSEVEQIRPLEMEEKTGTFIRFKPDFSIGMLAEFDHFKLLNHFHLHAYCIPAVTILFKDKRSDSGEEELAIIHHPHGLSEYVEYLNCDYQVIHPTFSLVKTVEIPHNPNSPNTHNIEVRVEVAFQYAETPQITILGFANSGEITSDSESLTSVENLIMKAIRQSDKSKYLERSTELPSKFGFLEGLTAVVSIWQEDPYFTSMINYRCLVSPSSREAVEMVFQELLDDVQNNHPDDWQRIIDHCLNNQKSRNERRFGQCGE